GTGHSRGPLPAGLTVRRAWPAVLPAGDSGRAAGKVKMASSVHLLRARPYTVNPILHFPGSSVLSPFRREQLLKRFSALGLPVADISGQYEHYVSLEAAPDNATQAQLARLLEYG